MMTSRSSLQRSAESFPPSVRVKAWRTYGRELWVDLICDFRDAVEAACREAGAEEEDIEALAEHEDQASVVAAAKEMAKTLTAARSKAAGRVPAALAKYEVLLAEGLSEEQERAVLDRLPRFFYFSDYELLKGECDLNELAERVKAGALSDGDETILSLLRLAGESPDDFLEEEYDSRKAELQAASIELSQQVFKYWKQNDALTVVFDTDMPVVGIDPQTNQEIRHRILKIELRDDRHGVETNFSTRSAGFQWFFSFLAAFSAYQDSPERVVVLLDEPGTSLHGEAQGDFLRYIFGELGALMGRRLDVRALVDGAETVRLIDKVRNAAKAVDIADQRIVVIGEMSGLHPTADIEDLFTIKDYLWLYSKAVSPLAETDLPPTPEPILRRLKVTRLQKGQEGGFDHALPAHELRARRAEFFDQVDAATLDQFEELFRLLRRT
jgi:hypothetical protein